MDFLFSKVDTTSMVPWGIVPLICAIAVFVRIVLLAHKKKGDTATYTWMGFFTFVLLFVAVLCFLQKVEGRIGVLAVSSITLTMFAYVLPLRKQVSLLFQTRYEQGILKNQVFVLAINVVVLLIVAFLSFATLEVSHNRNLHFPAIYFVLLDVGITFLFYLVLYFLGQRRCSVVIVGVLVVVIIAVVQNYLGRFKSAFLLPTDILAAQTAAAVAGELQFTVNDQILVIALLACTSIFCLLLAPPPLYAKGLKDKPRRNMLHSVAINVICSIVAFSALLFCTVGQNYQEQFGFKVYYWDMRNTAHDTGFLTTFLAAVQDLPVEKPDNYSDQNVQRIQETYAEQFDTTLAEKSGYIQRQQQFAEMKPSVVVVMNEAFSDLSAFNGLGTGYAGPTWTMNNPSDALQRGMLHVSTHGGGTCNTEFEFLTGMSMGYLGAGKYPYLIYSFDKVDSLPKQFANLGYETTGIHPDASKNWRRNTVYPAMGFKRTDFIDAFENPEMYHGFISDRELYKKIIQRLEDDDKPQFIFSVSIQNHIGNPESIPQEDRVSYIAEGILSMQDTVTLNSILACFNESDVALKEFIGELKALKKPVVLVFFGDHQPGLSRDVNDALFPGEEEPMHSARIMQTPYIVWANYDVAGASGEIIRKDATASSLAAEALFDIGGPLTNYQKSNLMASQEVPLVTGIGYCGLDGVWLPFEKGFTEPEALNNKAQVQYYRFKNM